MAAAAEERPSSAGSIIDARGRRVTQLDPVAMHLLHRRDAIPAEALRTIATAIDPQEVRKRPRAALLTPVWIAVWYAAFFGYFIVFKRWDGWDPVLVMFAIFYCLYPIFMLWLGARKARRARWERIRRIVLEHHYCPHCGYDLRGCPAGADEVTVCSECGAAWRIPLGEGEGDGGMERVAS
jgi:hypothetical protein